MYTNVKEAIEEAAAESTDGLQQALSKAVELASPSADMGDMDMGGSQDMGGSGTGAMPPAPRETEARAALTDLAAGDPAAALPKLHVALALATGPLKEAVEHAIADIEAGKTDEARGVLEEALPATG